MEGENLLVERYELDDEAKSRVGKVREPILNGMKETRTVGFVLMDVGSGVDLTTAEAQAAAFGTRGANNASLREYYLEASYNMLEFTGEVFETDVSLPSGCSTSQLMNIAESWEDEFGMQMDHWMGYIGSNASACQWGGIGWEGNANNAQSVSFYNSSDSCVVLAQEIGHNLGWMHNGTMDCGNSIMPDDPTSCSGNEYGSRISPMGGACLHLNAYDKWYQGYFGGCNGVRATASGTYTLLPIEIPCDGVQGIQIPMPKSRSFRNSSGGNAVMGNRYYLELRTKRGLDNKNTIPGPRVFVHVGPDVPAANRSSTFNWVLDMDPSTSAFDGMDVGDSFTDPAGGVTFAVQAMDNDRATINVTIANSTGAATCMNGSTFTAPGPTTCGAAGTGGMGGMGGMSGTAGMAGAGRGGMGGMGGMGGSNGAGAGMGGLVPGGAAGAAGSGLAGGAAGAAGGAGLGGNDPGGAAGAAGAGSGGAPIAGAAGAGVSGGAGVGTSGSAGAPAAGSGGAIAGGTGSIPPANPPVSDDPGGCGCRTVSSNRASSAWWTLTFVALGWFRRRRSRANLLIG
jgi:MYXO-CTERM domain-containing protein